MRRDPASAARLGQYGRVKATFDLPTPNPYVWNTYSLKQRNTALTLAHAQTIRYKKLGGRRILRRGETSGEAQ